MNPLSSLSDFPIMILQRLLPLGLTSYCLSRSALNTSRGGFGGQSRLEASIGVAATSRRVSNQGNANEQQVVLLEQLIRDAFETTKTDGIQALVEARKDGMSVLPTSDPATLWQATAQAVDYNRGRAASILNAWLATASSSSFSNDRSIDWAEELLQIATPATASTKKSNTRPKKSNSTKRNSHNNEGSNKSINNFTVIPDQVTYCLMAALWDEHQHDLQQGQNSNTKDDYVSAAEARVEEYLRLAATLSHASDSSSWRKLQAAARRRHRYPTFQAAETALQQTLRDDSYAVLYESDTIAVLNKPAGITVIPAKHAKQNKHSDLSSLLQTTVTCMATIHRGVLHRLDRGTSGCWIVAKTNRAHAHWVKHFFTRRVDKSYLCLVEGNPRNDAGNNSIALPVDGQPALSYYHVVRHVGTDANCRTLLQVDTKTGRKHQVRVHCAQGLGCPIVGDDRYGNGKGHGNPPLLLHASTVACGDILPPVQAPLPKHWEPYLLDE